MFNLFGSGGINPGNLFSPLKTSIFQTGKTSAAVKPEFADNAITASLSLPDVHSAKDQESRKRARDEARRRPADRAKSLTALDHMDRGVDPPFYKEWKEKRRKSKKYTFVKVLQTIKEKQGQVRWRVIFGFDAVLLICDLRAVVMN